MHGDEQPPEGGGQPGGGKDPAQQPSAFPVAAAPHQPGQRGQRQQLQPPKRPAVPGCGDGDGLEPARHSGDRERGQCGGQAGQPVASSSPTGETLNQRTAPPLVCRTTKFRPAQRVVLAPLGYVAHLVRDQAADGVEVLFRIRGRQRHAEGLRDAFDGGVAADPVSAVGQPEDVALVLVDVELVLDLAHDLLEHVLDGDQTRDPAELVDHDGQVIAVAAELAQQVVQRLGLGHEHGGAQQRPDVQLGRALQLEQVLGQQDADDVLAVALDHRKARVRRVDDDVQDLVIRRIDVDQVHARRGHHHVAGRKLGHADDALEHHARVGPDDVVVFGVGQGLDQLGLRVRTRMDELGDLLQESALVFPLGRYSRRVRVGHSLGMQDVRWLRDQ